MGSKFIYKFLAVFVIVLAACTIIGSEQVSAYALNPDPPLVYNTGPPPYGIPAYQKNQLQNCNYQPWGFNPAFWAWPGVFGANGSDNTTVPFGTTSVDLNFNWASAVCQGGVEVPESRLRFDQIDVNYINPDGTTGANAGYVTDTSGNSFINSTLTLINGGAQGDYRLALKDFQYHPPPGEVINSVRRVRINFHTSWINRMTNPGNAPTGYKCIAIPRDDVIGWDYNTCNDVIFPMDVTIYVDPFGEIGQSGCNLGNWDNNGQDAAIVGWAQDLDFWPTKVAVYADKRAYYPGMPAATLADLVPIGQYTANHQPRTFGPNPKPPPPSWNDWWIVPTRDTAALNDAYRHRFIINVIDMDANGNEVGQRNLGEVIIGACEQPKCGAYTGPGSVEANVPFNAKANFTYAAGSRGLAVQNDMGLDINGSRVATVSNRYWANGNSPPLGLNGQPAPPGATISNEVEANNVVLPNAGTYPVRWRIQWVVPPDPTLLNSLRNNHNAGGPYDYYSAGALFYATLDCPDGGNVTQEVGVKPYVKIYGNDIAAGGVFRDPVTKACDPSKVAAMLTRRPTILTQDRISASQNVFGASSQYAAYAIGEISQFSSGGMHSPRRATVPESPVNGMTIGNYNPDLRIGDLGGGVVGLDNDKVINYGGKGGQWRCIPNYYEEYKPSAAPTSLGIPVVNVGATSSGHYTSSTGNTIYLTGKNNLSGQHAIFIDDNVYIGNNFFDGQPNLEYKNAFSGVSDIPSVYLVVKGDIYISGATNRIDGVLVAQDDPATPATEGNIYTCARVSANEGVPVPANDIYSQCGAQLVINGALIANNIKLMRTAYSLKDSTENESWTNTRAGEVFKGSEAFYLSTPPPQFRKSNPKEGFDAVTSLPPIL